MIFFTTFVLGVAMVAMVAMAKHRADPHSNAVGGGGFSTTAVHGSVPARGAVPHKLAEASLPARRPARESCGRGGGEAAVAALQPSLEARGVVGRHLHGRGAEPLRPLLVVGRPALFNRTPLPQSAWSP